MSLYKGTDLISGHQVLYSTTGSNTDGAMTQNACTNNFADVSLSNLSSTATKNIDGQWVLKTLALHEQKSWAVGTNNASYSLSSYLPSDSYNYEVMVSADGNTGGTSGAEITYTVSSSFVTAGAYCLFRARTRTNSGVCAGGCTIIPIGTNRSLSVRVTVGTAATGNTYLHLLGYRRIGTNT